MLFDGLLVLILAASVIESIRHTHGNSITFSLLALGLAFLFSGSFAAVYTRFFTAPPDIAGIVYFLLTYAILYIVISVPTIIVSVVVKAGILGIVFFIVLQFVPVDFQTAIVKDSRLYPYIAPLGDRVFEAVKPLLSKINLPAITTWLQEKALSAKSIFPTIPLGK